jgi:phospholipid-binding lipoprotein MlaA
MTGIKICGTFLIAGMLLAGSARAEGDSDQGLGNRTPGQVSMRNKMTILSEATFPGPSDGTTSEKGTVNKEETAPIVEPVPTVEAAPKDESVPNAEVSPKPEAADKETEREDTVEEVTIADPIEPFNRVMFQFNDKLYFWALKPVARGYNAVVPEPVRLSVRNCFRNVKMPIRFVNSLFQGKFMGAGTELARFGINTTMGVAGFFDVAKSKFDLDPYDEDFGQTLGFYGMGGLMYIVWPILGPSTVRDTIGTAGDSFLNPVSYIGYFGPYEAALGVSAYEQINKTSLVLGTYEEMKDSSLEPYIGERDAYIQYRKKQISR